MNSIRTLLIVSTLCLPVCASVSALAASKGDHWVGTWASSPLVPSTIIENEQLKIGNDGTTLREIVRITLGGDTFRVRFTNLFGTSPLVIGAAEISRTLDASSIAPGTNKVLLFHGKPSITIEPGSLV